MVVIYGIWVVVISCITAAIYAWDKRSAAKGRNRVSEKTLLLWSILGGWPGGWIAGRKLRHKTSKTSFRWKFATAVAIHLGLVCSYLFWRYRIDSLGGW